MSEMNQIGIKQVLRAAWMAHAARLCAAGVDGDAMRQALSERVAADARARGRSGSAGTCEFAVTNLMRIWGAQDAPAASMRADALQVMHTQETAAQWALIMATYPFWAETATHVGRLLTIQTTATQVQIVQRLRERYGDRPTVVRYARYVLRAMVDWGVLRDTATSGIYEGSPRQAVNAAATALLAEGVLRANGGVQTAGTLLRHPALFPFECGDCSAADVLAANDRLQGVTLGRDALGVGVKKKTPAFM
jgi:hypothetical protein